MVSTTIEKRICNQTKIFLIFVLLVCSKIVVSSYYTFKSMSEVCRIENRNS